MTGFEMQTFGVGSGRSGTWATTTGTSKFGKTFSLRLAKLNTNWEIFVPPNIEQIILPDFRLLQMKTEMIVSNIYL